MVMASQDVRHVVLGGGVLMSLHQSIGDAIHGHNVMAVALSEIAVGPPCRARRVAREALTELKLNADHILKVRAEFDPIYAKMKKPTHCVSQG